MTSLKNTFIKMKAEIALILTIFGIVMTVETV